jgi:hypothetical protein
MIFLLTALFFSGTASAQSYSAPEDRSLGAGVGYTYLSFLRSFSYRMEGMTLFVAGRF